MGHDSKIMKVIVIFIIGLSFLAYSSKKVYADSQNTITLVNLTEEEARKKYILVAPRMVRKELLEKKLIEQIIVSEDWIAIGTESKVVGVFDTNGCYKYSIAFSADGIYYISYDEAKECLTVFIANGGTYFSFNEKG